MKILYFHQHFTTPTLGGGTRSYELAQRLIKHGHEVTVVCGEIAKLNLPPTKEKGVFRGDVDGIHVIQINLPYSNKDGLLKRAWVFVQFALKGVRIALKEQYDILFATTTPLTAGIPGIAAKWFRRKTFVFEVRDLWPELPKALGMKNPLALWGMNVLEWMSYHNADACIGLSPGICAGIAKRSQKNKRIELIPNGCDLEIFRPGNRIDLILDGIKPTDTVAVFTGAHGIANGLDAVLDTAVVLKQRGRMDIVLVFIGDGKTKQGLKDRATKDGLENCRFFDPMPKNLLSRIVANADIGLMVLANIPAFYYGTSPNKFFDYISSGLPILNNYPGWLADMITKEKCGKVIPPDNPEAFADALVDLADHPDRRKEYGTNARQLAERSFSRDHLGDQFVAFLEDVEKK
ncbi:glycosyltransferase family 4 protein [Massilibacteroides sp.]|uniref:glycosyltransferase family 4 protein n=1 Tax=Massilibacteroides sp. TaxID=2034766 RepID=UPI002632C651|nr:glycosyltransferase family 4 protein [Massilibacteroides sp.]MDD4515963.1 glycosyltransferase family 4 protein [Massilibacteroides sp.]